jgi:ABC-type antimicrobial peptide transport system permease subunit
VRGLGLSFLLRRAGSARLLLGCVAVTVLLTTGFAAVLWTFSVGVIPPGALSFLSAPQSRVLGISSVGSATQAAAYSRLISRTLRQAWPGVGFQTAGALWADPIQLPASGSSPVTTQVQPATLAGISAHATLTAGQWPPAPSPGGPLPVALPAAAASRLHLTVGSVLTGAPESGGATISLRVTGLFKPDDPGSTYWALDLLPTSGISVHGSTVIYAGNSLDSITDIYGPAVVNPAAFSRGLAARQCSWSVLPQALAMARANIGTLAANTSAAVSQLTVAPPQGLSVTSGLPQLLAGLASTIVLARSLFTVAALQLLLLAGAELVLAARLLASLREEESALLRARGATRWQVARPALAEAVLLGAVAGLAGVLAGARLASSLAGLVHLRLDNAPGHGITAPAWFSALAVLVLGAAVLAWPALRALTPDAARRRRGRQAWLAGIAWAGGDLAVVALAAVAVWELRGYSVVAHPATGSLGIDPVVAIAPALALAGVALIPLRGLPLLARLADKATDHERRLTAAMVSWQIARRPIRQAGPALLVVVTTATTTLALAGYATWQRSAADQAAFSVGADVRVDTAAPLALGATGAVTRAPGVTAATSASLADAGNGGQLIALDARTAGQTILIRPDLSPLPLSALWPRITPRRLSGIALPGRPDRLEILASLGAGPHTRAAQLRKGLGAPAVTAWVQDAAGATYQLPAAAPLPADGRPHALVFAFSAGRQRQAGYPLRVLGLTLTYDLPPFSPAKPVNLSAVLSVESLAVAATADGPFGRPFSPGAGLAAWSGTGNSSYVPAAPPGPFSTVTPADGTAPAILGWQPAGDAQQLTFTVGHLPSPQVIAKVGYSTVPTAQVAIMAGPSSPVVPAIATAGYLTANRLGIGSTFSLQLGGYPVTFQIVASVARFPTVFGRNRALIADLAQINDILTAAQVPSLPVTRWWLRTAGGRVPHLPAGLGLSVTDRASQQAALLRNPLLKAPRQAMLATGAAAVLLGVLGFSVSVAASLRSRRTQSAVFAALGVGKNAQAGQLCLEQCALSLPAAAAGLLAGIGLAQLMVPAITLTVDAAPPIPSALVILPLGPAAALALVTAAAPVAAAALSVLRRPDPAARLRMEAG